MATERTASNTPSDGIKKEQRRQSTQENLEATQLASLVQEQVMRSIEQPPNFLQLKIRPLWKHHFRANLYVGLDGANARISNSYFIVTNDDGAIVRATPSLPSVKREAQTGASPLTVPTSRN
jgi:hypothetical protein